MRKIQKIIPRNLVFVTYIHIEEIHTVFRNYCIISRGSPNLGISGGISVLEDDAIVAGQLLHISQGKKILAVRSPDPTLTSSRQLRDSLSKIRVPSRAERIRSRVLSRERLHDVRIDDLP